MKLENEVLSVEIAELGAEVTGISDREKNTDILWEGNPSFWKRHSPVLFPNVGKTYGNEVLIEGNKFPTVQHGFARDSVFTCVSSSADAASFRLASSEETKKVYPYDFELYITYTLKGKNLKVEWKVKNCSEKIMYFTIGGHPAFRFAEKGEKKEDYLLKFPGKESLTYILVDPNTGTGVPDQTYTLELTDGMCPVTEEMFLRDALIFDGGQFEEVWLCSPAAPLIHLEPQHSCTPPKVPLCEFSGRTFKSGRTKSAVIKRNAPPFFSTARVIPISQTSVSPKKSFPGYKKQAGFQAAKVMVLSAFNAPGETCPPSQETPDGRSQARIFFP